MMSYIRLTLSYVWYHCPYIVQFYCMSSCRNLVCLGCSFRYWFLAASRLVARFARVRALQTWGLARGGPLQLKAAPKDEPNPYPLVNALEGGGIPLALSHFQCIIAVLCVPYFVRLVPGCIACLVMGILYVLCIASGTTVSLRSPSQPSAACGRFAPAAGPSGPHLHREKRSLGPGQRGASATESCPRR